MTEQATETPVVSASKKGRIGTITLSRKGNNSIAGDLGDGLVAALDQLEADDEVRVIVVRSAYEKYFSVGADLTELGGADRSDPAAMEEVLLKTIRYIQACFTRLERSPKVVIAAINGHALGGGCELALSCDYRIMVNDGKATIGQTEVNLGIIPGAGGTQRLPRAVGRAKALEMMLEGTRVTAEEALKLGLVNEAPGPDEFEAAVQAKADKLAAGAPIAQAMIKQAINDGLGKETIEEGLEVEAKLFAKSAMTEDAVVGVLSFLSKQTPEFTGK
ncbi:MAG: enoyl-CoA hydratase/isomerase family protein [Candidatus Dormiibacterota bacterium]